ncbi:hypothetical protein Btru_020533 [Bulinus truncatus]|nr:hypothetical protein Btru_020533 [Bulinus truncatus]
MAIAKVNVFRVARRAARRDGTVVTSTLVGGSCLSRATLLKVLHVFSKKAKTRNFTLAQDKGRTLQKSLKVAEVNRNYEITMHGTFLLSFCLVLVTLMALVSHDEEGMQLRMITVKNQPQTEKLGDMLKRWRDQEPQLVKRSGAPVGGEIRDPVGGEIRSPSWWRDQGPQLIERSGAPVGGEIRSPTWWRDKGPQLVERSGAPVGGEIRGPSWWRDQGPQLVERSGAPVDGEIRSPSWWRDQEPQLVERSGAQVGKEIRSPS